VKKIAVPPFGMRTKKTVLSVTICILIFSGLTELARFVPPQDSFVYDLLRFLLERPSPIFACIAAVIAMQSTVENSLALGNSRIIGTAIGGAVGLLLLWLDSLLLARRFHILFVALGMILVVQSCLLLRRKLSVPIGLVTFLVIMLTLQENNPYLYAVNRILDTTMGIGVSLAVNLIVSPPKQGETS